MSSGGRGWGPFSGGQLTTIIVIVAIAVCFPVGAWAAVSFTNVAITDPGGVNQAKVDSAGNVQAKVNGGTISVQSGAPNQLFRSPETQVASSSGSVCVQVVDSSAAYPLGGGGSPAKAEIITEIDAAVTGSPGDYWQLFRNSSCSGTAVKDFNVAGVSNSAQTHANVQGVLPSGLAIPAGQGLYVLAHSGVGVISVFFSATGYLVPASAVPAGA